MKKIAYCLIASALLLAGCHKNTKVLDLSQWEFEYDGQWLSATVPSCIHTDLMAHDIIPDPFYGTNEDSVQWVSARDWTYRTTFLGKDVEANYADLEFDGLQCYADVLLNGDTILRADNMFIQYTCSLSVDSLLDTNILEVHFHPTSVADSIALAALGYDVPDHRVFSRTAPYQQGWDWGPKLNSCGIWKPVRIVMWNGPSGQDRPISDIYDCEVRKGTWFDNHVITFEAKEDSVGLAYTFYDNGEPVFCKGANWIPCHSFPVLTPALKERYRTFLTSAKEANFNMIRIWGGGIYEHDYFFDLCDSLGLMVWMDFNFSCALYPSDPEMLENIQKEAEQQVRRIAKHPCVVLWCGNNEVKNGWEDWGWQGQYQWTPEQIAELQHGIDTIFGQNGVLANAVRALDPLKRSYVTSSPLYGWGHPECVTHGDSHYWGVWWGELPFEVYKEKTGRFMSEYGFQSYPEWSTIERFCPEDQRTIDSPTMKNHQKHGRGVQIIDKAMMQYYGLDSKSLSLKEYCYVSQLLQAWGMGYGILQHLLAQPHCMGTLYWQLNDCWPVASWSSIDCFGNWKALHYRAKALYAEDADLEKWEAYYQIYPKDLHLESDPQLEYSMYMEDGQLNVKLRSKGYARDVMVTTIPHIDGHFTENYLDIDQETKVITFIPLHPEEVAMVKEVEVMCLNSLLK